MSSARVVKKRRMRPIRALRAVRRLMDEPDDTELVFQIISDLTGANIERIFAKVMADPTGRRILEERRSLTPVLSDRDALRGLSDGTLGREYARFMDAEQISASGLAEASRVEDYEYLDDRAECLSDRIRDMHDLWHVVTGYGRDYLGEAALLAFTYAQTRNRGIALIVWMAKHRYKKEGHAEAVPFIDDGYRRGSGATYLPAVDWESLLAEPLDTVRNRLGIDPQPAYQPIDA